jgi:hypothetical protein
MTIDPRAQARATELLKAHIASLPADEQQRLDYYRHDDDTFDLEWNVVSDGTTTTLDLILGNETVLSIPAADIGIHVIGKELIYVPTEAES